MGAEILFRYFSNLAYSERRIKLGENWFLQLWEHYFKSWRNSNLIQAAAQINGNWNTHALGKPLIISRVAVGIQCEHQGLSRQSSIPNPPSPTHRAIHTYLGGIFKKLLKKCRQLKFCVWIPNMFLQKKKKACILFHISLHIRGEKMVLMVILNGIVNLCCIKVSSQIRSSLTLAGTLKIHFLSPFLSSNTDVEICFSMVATHYGRAGSWVSLSFVKRM